MKGANGAPAMQIRDFLDNLPQCSKIPLRPNAHPAISCPIDNPNFVPPPLRVKGDGEAYDNIPFVVISAPGAVGKSTLAEHIAASRALALWDLSRLALGDNTFIGTLANAFGPTALPNILSGLQNGNSLFVFDALDEAELLSGWDRVEAFVREIWTYTDAASRTVAILLARTETAFLLDLLLEELGSKQKRHAVLEIDYFDEAGAKLFLDRQLSLVFKVDLHRQHSQPFQSAADSVFAVLGHALSLDKEETWSNPVGRTFLGYAPVLQAIAAHLASLTNFQEAISSLEVATAGGTQSELLRTSLRCDHSYLIILFLGVENLRARPSGILCWPASSQTVI